MAVWTIHNFSLKIIQIYKTYEITIQFQHNYFYIKKPPKNETIPITKYTTSYSTVDYY